ncbi:MAG: hypothetical protein JXA33_19870 [Anaerolineae bacterium]|nr:hypothetical protein [Anaerolineae bacterium]
MAKKKRDKSSPKLSASQLYHPQKAQVAGTAESAVQTVDLEATSVPGDAALVEEYRYVLTDLKKIAWLAIMMLALLVVLAFVIV